MSEERNNNQAETMKLEVRVRPVDSKNSLAAFASVTINESFVVDGLKIQNGKNGLFVSMPSIQDGSGKYHDVCFPITADFRQKLTKAVLDGYDAAIEKMQTTLEAAGAVRRDSDKPSVLGQINAKSKEIQAHIKTPVTQKKAAMEH